MFAGLFVDVQSNDHAKNVSNNRETFVIAKQQLSETYTFKNLFHILNNSVVAFKSPRLYSAIS
jgi:hypothetical protein